MVRKNIIAGNWKMNNFSKETEAFFASLGNSVKNADDREVIIAPSFPYLEKAVRLTKGTSIQIAAQNFYPEDSGAFTGEVSPLMLQDLGVTTVLIGHSERRHVLGEDLEILRKKVSFAQAKGLKIIFCIGETLEQRNKNELYAVIEHQISTAFDDNLKAETENIVIAYEPVWAIGTGVVATPEQAEDMHSFIRKYIAKRYDRSDMRILYGGSVKPDNIKDLMAKENIDGVLVGGASVTADSFSKLVLFDK